MIFAFDFDGVLCDSARETGTSGARTLISLGFEADYHQAIVDFPVVSNFLDALQK